jgi:hypothetical protein
MTTYPLEFHRRSEQKWVLRAQAARESPPRAALVGNRGSDQSERRDILARRPYLRELGQWAPSRVQYPVPERLAALLKAL